MIMNSQLFSVVSQVLFTTLLCKGESIQLSEQTDYKNHKNYPLVANEDGCGESFMNRIIGGRDAGLGQFPWLVRIEKSPGGSFCGGSLISTVYIVTAAHCEPLGHSSRSRVVVGDHNRLTDPDCVEDQCAPPAQIAEIETFLVHPKWITESSNGIGPYDIALVRLKAPVTFNDYVKPICLPLEPEDQIDITNQKVDIAGWGIVNIIGDLRADTLQTLKIKVMPNSTCGSAHKHMAPRARTMTSLCGGGVVGEDSCTGDSGSPLMRARTVDGLPSYAILGVVSFGMTKCAKTDKPGFYTDVRLFLDWLLDNIEA